ncbi:CLUMA_CG000675, isoform A [Clunio marinus]|uniref:CLUMA_CG000675, isoform A n=1 Tax=Clunio marinus TaxID=568069 RepID=A0A1J1HFS5_9DIPT|nr:CLUMA_CG000675, isoform A [Clunio marinus]
MQALWIPHQIYNQTFQVSHCCECFEAFDDERLRLSAFKRSQKIKSSISQEPVACHVPTYTQYFMSHLCVASLTAFQVENLWIFLLQVLTQWNKGYKTNNRSLIFLKRENYGKTAMKANLFMFT